MDDGNNGDGIPEEIIESLMETLGEATADLSLTEELIMAYQDRGELAVFSWLLGLLSSAAHYDDLEVAAGALTEIICCLITEQGLPGSIVNAEPEPDYSTMDPSPVTPEEARKANQPWFTAPLMENACEEDGPLVLCLPVGYDPFWN